MMSAEIFTPAVTRVMYERITDLFGPGASWQDRTFRNPNPGEEKFDAFRQWCVDFAVAIGSRSPRMVRQQIGYAFATRADIAKFDETDWLYTFVRNKAAAKEAGFIRSSELEGFPQETADGQ